MTDEEIKPTRKRPIALIVALGIGGVVIIAGMIAIQMKYSDKFVDYNMVLKISAKGINLTCPKEVAEGVRLDSVGAKFDRQLWYYYTITAMVRDEETIEEFCKTYNESILESLKGNPEMAEFGKNKVTLVFDLYDKKHANMCTVQAPPDKYYTPKEN